MILGDSGYAIEPWLIIPYLNPQTPDKRKYNRLFKSELVIIERCFGQLKRRFSFLHHPCRVPLRKVPKLIVCCIILHNVAKYLQDPDFPDPLDEGMNGGDVIVVNDNERQIRQIGCQVRNQLTATIDCLL